MHPRQGCTDGSVLSGPDKCKIDFSKLLCHGAPNSTCLTQPQIDGVRAVLDGPAPVAVSRLVRLEPDFQAWVGNVVSRGQTPPAIPDTSEAGFAIGVFGQWLNPPVTVANFNIDTDWPSFVAQLGSVIDLIDPDLRAFKRRGGKMIQYHGIADGLISTKFSIETFNNVVDFNRAHNDHGHDNGHDKGRHNGHENGDKSDALAGRRISIACSSFPAWAIVAEGRGRIPSAPMLSVR